MDEDRTIDTKAIVERCSEIVSAAVGEETAMLNIEQGKYYGLDDIGSHIWAQLEIPCSVDQICANLRERYEVDAETCFREVSKFIEELLEAGVVRIASA